LAGELAEVHTIAWFFCQSTFRASFDYRLPDAFIAAGNSLCRHGGGAKQWQQT